MTDFGTVVDNPAAGRYELGVEEHTAFAYYELDENSIVFTHTEVPPELEGRGVGSALARGALDAARARGLEVVPMCPFIAAYIRRHPAWLDLVSDQNQKRFQLRS